MSAIFGTKEITPVIEAYAVVGHALTWWAAVENALCVVYCDAINPNNPFPARHAYWAVVSFEGRLKMTNRVIEQRFELDKDILSEWADLMDALEEKNTMRNKVAHGTVLTQERTSRKGKVIGSAYLVPYYYGRAHLNRRSYHQKNASVILSHLKAGRKVPKLRPQPRERISVKQIGRFGAELLQLEKRVLDFATRVYLEARRQAGRPPASGGSS